MAIKARQVQHRVAALQCGAHSVRIAHVPGEYFELSLTSCAAADPASPMN